MQKLPCSIGTYTLKELTFNKGRQGDGFCAELWKGPKPISALESYGDGGCTRLLYDKTLSGVRKMELMVQEDMRELLTTCKATRDSLGYRWNMSPESAMVGFSELLLDLGELAKVSEKYLESTPASHNLVIYTTGTSWLRSIKNFDNKEGVYVNRISEAPDTIQRNELRKMLMNTLLKDGKKLSMLRIVKGKGEWFLSFAEYAKLLENADNINN